MEKANAVNVHQAALMKKNNAQISLNEYIIPFRKISNIVLKTASSKLVFLENNAFRIT